MPPDTSTPGLPNGRGSRPDAASEQTPLLSGSGAGDSTTDRARDTGKTADDASDEPNHPIGTLRAIGVASSLFLLIFLLSQSFFPASLFPPYLHTSHDLMLTSQNPASNFSGMSMAQGAIADDLHDLDQVSWLTTSGLIPTSSLAPVAGRLATIFHPRALVPVICSLIALGTLLCAVADSAPVFILGRVVAGIGSAGVLTLAVIIVLELTGKKNRGVFIGLVNSGMTIGVSVGAIVYGALLPAIGWVRFPPCFDGSC